MVMDETVQCNRYTTNYRLPSTTASPASSIVRVGVSPNSNNRHDEQRCHVGICNTNARLCSSRGPRRVLSTTTANATKSSGRANDRLDTAPTFAHRSRGATTTAAAKSEVNVTDKELLQTARTSDRITLEKQAQTCQNRCDYGLLFGATSQHQISETLLPPQVNTPCPDRARDWDAQLVGSSISYHHRERESPTKPAETTRKGAPRKQETKVDFHEAGDNPEQEQRGQKNNEAASKSKRGRGAFERWIFRIVADQGRGRRRRPLVPSSGGKTGMSGAPVWFVRAGGYIYARYRCAATRSAAQEIQIGGDGGKGEVAKGVTVPEMAVSLRRRNGRVIGTMDAKRRGAQGRGCKRDCAALTPCARAHGPIEMEDIDSKGQGE
ncbi:hypothetical protein BC826DRAFT_970169 [Russula brevipes]|nr:hypothetical protein BC826DRAFT_970169 [Russula brevipes]